MMLDNAWAVAFGAAAAAGVWSLWSGQLDRPDVPAGSWLRAQGTIVGHRGSRTPAHPSGNTLGSFRTGLAAGAVAVELDVQLTEDRELVVFHDAHTGALLRGEQVDVRRATMAELRRRRFAAPADSKEVVPTLHEVLTAVHAQGAYVVVELKGLGARYGAELADAALAAINAHPVASRVAIISFNPFALYQARKTDPNIPTALIAKPGMMREVMPGWLHPLAWFLDQVYVFAATTPWALPRFLGATGMSLKHAMWTPELAEQARGAGLHLNSWTVNSPEEVRRLHAIGVTALTTDDPAMAVAALQTAKECC